MPDVVVVLSRICWFFLHFQHAQTFCNTSLIVVLVFTLQLDEFLRRGESLVIPQNAFHKTFIVPLLKWKRPKL